MAVCIKPRLIRQGFQMMDTLNDTQDAFEQMNRLFDQGIYAIYKKFYVKIKNIENYRTFMIDFHCNH